MNKKEVWEAFKEEIMPGILEEEAKGTGRPDLPRRAEAWGVYTDTLCKMGAITQTQYDSWQTPSQLRRKKKV